MPITKIWVKYYVKQGVWSKMRIGIPREIKPLEGRGLIPAAAAELVKLEHKLFIEQGAGELSGYDDAQYSALGVELLPDAASLYGAAEMIVKVKEPIEPEIGLLRIASSTLPNTACAWFVSLF